MDENITFPVPGDKDHVVDPPSGETDASWEVPDEPEFPAAEDAEEAEDEAKQVEEVPADEEPEAEETEEAAPPPEEEWDGRIESIPEEYRPYVERKHKDMERGFHAKMRKLADLQHEYEAKLEKANAPPPEKDDGPPPWPGPDATAEEYQRASDARAQYAAEEAVKNAMGNVIPKLDEQQAALVKQEGIQRYERLTKKEGFTPEIEARMTELVEQSQHWQEALQSDEGLNDLFEHASLQASARQKSQKTARRKASASKRSVPRPQDSGAPKETTPADRYGGTLEQDGMDVAKDLGLRW